MRNHKFKSSGSFAISVVSIATLLYFSSCESGDKCNAGTGGDITLILKPQHHGAAISNQPGYADSAFIKFLSYPVKNYLANEFPGEDASDYDMVATGTTGTAEVVVSGLRCGKYYIYMTGFDTSIVERVKGGIPIEITERNGTVVKTIPVTED